MLPVNLAASGEESEDARRWPDALQQDLDAWLRHYNTERPHLGYRNQGQKLIEAINQFVRLEG